MSKHKVKRYDGEYGSEVEVGGPNPVPDTSATDLPPASMGAAKPTPEEQPTSFKSAFAAARRAGDKTFEYNGKSYTTDLASSAPSKTAKAVGNAPGGSSPPSKVLTVSKTGVPGGSMPQRSKGTVMDQGRNVDLYGGTISSMKKALSGSNTAPTPPSRVGFDASKVDPNTLLPKRMAKGGSVSSASSRADGIATKGKTRGTMVMCGGGMAKGRK